MSWVTRTQSRRSANADAVIESLVSWRESCQDVHNAYRSWTESARPRRALAFAGYRAALDREQHAARIYSDSAERIRALAP
jgi:hypothetical protein